MDFTLILQKSWLVRVVYLTPTEMYTKLQPGVLCTYFKMDTSVIYQQALSFTPFVRLKTGSVKRRNNNKCPTVKAHILHHLF